jgi:hypothetical protein
MRYFLLKDENTLEVYLSQELEVQPDNSIPFQVCDWKRAKFDIYPNPTKIEELIVKELEIIPEKVTKRQLRQALILSDFNLLEIDNFIKLIEDNKQQAIIDNFWNNSSEFERWHPILIQFSYALGFTEKQVNQLFILAQTL